MDVVSNSIEQMLGSATLKEIKSVIDLGSDIECVQRIKSTIGAILHKYHPFQASSDLERHKIKKYRRIYDELVYLIEEQAASTEYMDRKNSAAEKRIFTTPFKISSDSFKTNSRSRQHVPKPESLAWSGPNPSGVRYRPRALLTQTSEPFSTSAQGPVRFRFETTEMPSLKPGPPLITWPEKPEFQAAARPSPRLSLTSSSTSSNSMPDACLISIYEDNPAPSLSTPFVPFSLPQGPSFCESFLGQMGQRLRDGGSNNLFAHVLKTIRSKMIRNEHSFKLMLIALNVIAEGGEATISQVKNDGKMDSNLYLELSIIITSFCLMMVLVEAVYEARKYGVVWQKRGRFRWWWYYRENQGRPFGSFSLYFGFISSMIQLIIHLTEKLTKNDIIKFDYMPLLLAVSYLVAAIIDHPRSQPHQAGFRGS